MQRQKLALSCVFISCIFYLTLMESLMLDSEYFVCKFEINKCNCYSNSSVIVILVFQIQSAGSFPEVISHDSTLGHLTVKFILNSLIFSYCCDSKSRFVLLQPTFLNYRFKNSGAGLQCL